MNAQMILAESATRGLTLEARGNRAIVVRPGSAAPPELLEAIRQHKAELLALLSAPSVFAAEEDELDRLAHSDGWEPPKEISPSIVAEIQRIEAEALRLGWSRQRLWRFEFWPQAKGEPRGLASVMNDDDAIVALSKDYIAIGSRGRNFKDYRRFWRLDA